MNKTLIAAPLAVAASLLVGLTVGGVNAGNRPTAGTGTLVAEFSGEVATLDGLGAVVPADVTGSATLTVNQVALAPIVMANIDLPEGMTFVSADWDLSGECDETNAVVNYVGKGDLTVKGISCVDGDSSGTVDFVLSVTNAHIASEIQVAGDYHVDSQYRTNANRKNKDYSWVLHDEDGVVISELSA